MNNSIKRIEVSRMMELKGDMTQKQFEDKTGISQTSCSKIMNNQQRLSADNIIKLAEAFNISADWILGRTEDKTPPAPTNDAGTITYGDIFKVLTFLLQERGLQAIPDSFLDIHGNNIILTNTNSLLVNDKILGSILSIWGRTVTAPPNVYTNWRNECIEAYSEISYLSWDAAIQNAYNHFFGAADISPETLKVFQENLLDIFKKISSEKDTSQ